MDNIYLFADMAILERIGKRIHQIRLKQNITQQSLAEAAGISLSTIKKIENGEIRSFESLLRVLRTLGMLETLQPLVEEEQLSPSEYYKYVQSAKAKSRKRASGKLEKEKREDKIW